MTENPVQSSAHVLCTRRAFLQGAAGAWLGVFIAQTGCRKKASLQGLAVTAEPLTRGPAHHWFGYYDKLQFDPTNRWVLGMEVDFEDRHPGPDDTVAIGMVDRADGNRWIPLARSGAWSWQQGCMLQWLPGSRDEIVFNDREGDAFVSRVMNVSTGRVRTLSMPVYALSPDGATAVTTDFARIGMIRYGYGYPVRAGDKARPVFARPEDTGIWRLELGTGRGELIVSLARLLTWPGPGALAPEAVHWTNHLLYSPDGRRIVFLHRYRLRNRTQTRMLTCDPDGGNLHQINPGGYMSHFVWRDSGHLLAWASVPGRRGAGFFLFTDKTREAVPVGADLMKENGHVSFLKDPRWILNDTYATGAERVQSLYLYDSRLDRRHDLGRFPMPARYQGGLRCDLHPRASPDGRLIVFDSTHAGAGRQMHLMDVTELVATGDMVDEPRRSPP